MIGLRRGVVELVPHHAEWRALFEQERRLLSECLGALALDIQHVGSTAVPDLPAKPIIDVAVVVATAADVERCQGPLLELGYLDRGDQGDEGGWLFAKERAPGVRTIHLQIVTIDDPQWRHYLRFRDALRTDAALRAAYAELKISLQARFPRDRERYIDGKRAFIRSALHGGNPTSSPDSPSDAESIGVTPAEPSSPRLAR